MTMIEISIIIGVIAGAILVGVSVAVAHRMGRRAAIKKYNRTLEEHGLDLSDGGIFGNIDQALHDDDSHEQMRKAWKRHVMWNRILPWRWVKFSIARVNQSKLEADAARLELEKAWRESWNLKSQLREARLENRKLRGESPLPKYGDSSRE
jgi:hypothetical protein